MYTQTGPFDPWSGDHRADPQTLYAHMRVASPVYEGIGPETGRSFWFLTRYDDVADTLRNPVLGRDVEHLSGALRDQHRFEGEEMLALANHAHAQRKSA